MRLDAFLKGLLIGSILGTLLGIAVHMAGCHRPVPAVVRYV